MKNTTNIPQTGFQVLSQQNSSKRGIISIFSRGQINLSLFSIIQLMFGFKIWLESIHDEEVKKELLLLYMELSEAAIENKPEVKLDVSYNTLNLMRQFVEARMTHCEQERDQRSEKFNPDTYIGMKLLLLDIRETLIGEIVEMD